MQNGQAVLLKVGPTQFEWVRHGTWVMVTGQAMTGYSETFGTASAQWTVNHNLGRFPSKVSVRSLGGLEVDAEVLHLSVNSCIVSFNNPFAGRVEIS